MKSLLRYTIQLLRRLWLRWTCDDPYKIRLAQCRPGDGDWTTVTVQFRREQFDVLCKACRITSQTSLTFLQEAALERAYLILQLQNRGGSHESRVN